MKISERYKFVIAYFLEHAPEAETELIYDDPFQLLVSVILSFTIYIRSEIKQGQQSKVIKELRLEVDQLQKRIK